MVLVVTLKTIFFRMLDLYTSHTAIEAIGGLNLPVGGIRPPLESTLRTCKMVELC